MYEFNDIKDLGKAVDRYGDSSKQELIAELCYYKDRFELENRQCTWLDHLASYLRDTSDKEQEQVSDEAYEEYQFYSRKFNKKWR